MSNFRPWFVSVSCINRRTKELNFLRVKFLSDAETVTEAYDAICDSGFACVRRVGDRVIPAAGLIVKLAKEAS
jgi:hypothetical protein